MYPQLNESYQIKGTNSNPYLVNSQKVEIIPLRDEKLANLLVRCNGQNSIESLAQSFEVNPLELLQFFKQFEGIGTLKFLPTPSYRQVSCRMAERSPWLKEVHFDVTGKCNLAHQCKHCFRGDKLNLQDDRDANEWARVIEELSVIGTYLNVISGGEPFLRQDLPKIITTIIANNILLSALFTNGTLRSKIVDETFELIIKNQLQTKIYLSLDGPDPETHDANRGAGAYKKILAFLKHLTRLRSAKGGRYKIIVNSQVNTLNFKRLVEWYETLENIGIDRWRLTSGRVIGNLKKNSYLLPPWIQLFDEYAKLIVRYLKKYRDGQAKMEVNIESFFTSDMVRNATAYVFSDDLPICDYKEHAISIEPSGEVQFCTSWGGQSFGNVFNQKVEEIWYSDKLQLLKQFKIKEITDCCGCVLLRYCGGGCRLMAKSIDAKDIYACQKYGIYAEKIVPIMADYGIIFTNDK